MVLGPLIALAVLALCLAIKFTVIACIIRRRRRLQPNSDVENQALKADTEPIAQQNLDPTTNVNPPGDRLLPLGCLQHRGIRSDTETSPLQEKVVCKPLPQLPSSPSTEFSEKTEIDSAPTLPRNTELKPGGMQ
ncbi:hypothetical protein BGZ80_010857 [Entomortierella chlamydospora]|uniref:Uncharacterized protein n=1 Tax=Entomortierella chlamydospora TaxID=101097 RepID=A0A9P6SZG3_9FUNG|nr:hypothetical protein BGZ79_000792 [Entomortierella chlamydospora]KAG0013786.1 hypothetical protein BGZ80_010857 [Entomortierella chlamydospora]